MLRPALRGVLGIVRISRQLARCHRLFPVSTQLFFDYRLPGPGFCVSSSGPPGHFFLGGLQITAASFIQNTSQEFACLSLNRADAKLWFPLHRPLIFQTQLDHDWLLPS